METQENRRILVIDDNESIHADFRKILAAGDGLIAAVESAAATLFDDATVRKPAGARFQIDSAHQGEEGLALVQESVAQGQPYALAFVDVRMPPGWNGVETIRRIWKVDSRLQAVICTAYSDYSWNQMIEELGETDNLLILKKPFDIVEVRQLTSALVMKWNLAQKASRTMRDLEEMVRDQMCAIHGAQEETIHRLVRASLCRDEETGSHIRRTGLYSELLAATAGWDAERVNQIRLAAPMHDVGKIGIPDAILRKPGKLTSEEAKVLQDHAVLGAKMLAGSASPVLRMAQEIAMSHHEHWDGAGYPSGLKGDQIPESARIVAIVDVYDALTHDRVYRERLPEAEVMGLMRAGRGTQFDPRLLDVFMSLLPEMRAIAQCAPDEDVEHVFRDWGSTLSLR